MNKIKVAEWAIETYGNEDINKLLEQLEKSCRENGLVYAWTGWKERQYARHILSKKFATRISEYKVDLYTFIDSVIRAATTLKYNTKQVTSTVGFYYNCWDIINKRQLEKKNKKEVFIPSIPKEWIL